MITEPSVTPREEPAGSVAERSLLRGLRVMREVSGGAGATAEEISRNLDLPLSTVYRLLATLKSVGLAEQARGRYFIGRRSHTWPDRATWNLPLFARAAKYCTGQRLPPEPPPMFSSASAIGRCACCKYSRIDPSAIRSENTKSCRSTPVPANVCYSRTRDQRWPEVF